MIIDTRPMVAAAEREGYRQGHCNGFWKGFALGIATCGCAVLVINLLVSLLLRR